MKRQPGVLRDKSAAAGTTSSTALGRRKAPADHQAGVCDRRRGRRSTRERAEIRAGTVPVPDNDSVAAFAKSWIACVTGRRHRARDREALPRSDRAAAADDRRDQAARADGTRPRPRVRRAARRGRAARPSERRTSRHARCCRRRFGSARSPRTSRPTHDRRARRLRERNDSRRGPATSSRRFLERRRRSRALDASGRRGMDRDAARRDRRVKWETSTSTTRRSRSAGASEGPRRHIREAAQVRRRPTHRRTRRTASSRLPRRTARRRRNGGLRWVKGGAITASFSVEVDGSPIDPERLSKRWGDLVRRHAPATRIADDPVPRSAALALHATARRGCPARCGDRTLGHTSVAFTLQQYAHRYAGDQRSPDLHGYAKSCDHGRDHRITIVITMRRALALGFVLVNVVPEVGFEPTRPCEQRILSPPCLPFHHSGAGPVQNRDRRHHAIRYARRRGCSSSSASSSAPPSVAPSDDRHRAVASRPGRATAAARGRGQAPAGPGSGAADDPAAAPRRPDHPRQYSPNELAALQRLGDERRRRRR